MKGKILVDTTSLISTLSGIGRYTCENAKRLKEFQDEIEWFYYYGYFSKKLSCLEKKSNKNVKSLKSVIVKSALLKRAARKILKLFTKLSFKTFDIYWQPNYFPEPSVKARHTVASVHDFSVYKNEDWHPKERIGFFKKHFPSVKNVDKIITGSHYTKSEIVEYLGIDEDKIEVIYHGVNNELFKIYQMSDLEIVRKHCHLPQKFILFVGSIEPRKNLFSLIEAYKLLDPKIKAEYKLLFVGGDGWNNVEIKREMQKEDVMHIENVDDFELACIYNLASLFVYPSWYEGFGIPPLEAFACGTPVISSNASSLPEVCGDAAIYVSPENIKLLSQRMKEVLGDKNLQNELIEKGLKRAKYFSWEKAAKEHRELFKKLLT